MLYSQTNYHSETEFLSSNTTNGDALMRRLQNTVVEVVVDLSGSMEGSAHSLYSRVSQAIRKKDIAYGI